MRIMVPLDGSRFGEHALPLAIQLAQDREANIDLVHVHTVAPMTYMEGVPQLDASIELEQREADRSYLGRAQGRVAAAGIQTETFLLDGPTISSLRDHAERSGASLIVMSTHGRGPLSRAWLGSIADGLARHSPVPVLLVRPRSEHASDPEFTALDSLANGPPRHILIPLDGTPQSEAAVPAASSIVGQTGRMTLLHVLSPARVVGGHIFTLEDEAMVVAASAARERLAPVLAQCEGLAVEATLDVVVERDTADAILAAANRAGADLIALSTHARGGLSRLLFGSVTDKVLRSAGLPVLVVPPAEQDGNGSGADARESPAT